MSVSPEDLEWDETILESFGSEVFLVGRCGEGGVLDVDVKPGVWEFGRREGALWRRQMAATDSARWQRFWWAVSISYVAAYRLLV